MKWNDIINIVKQKGFASIIVLLVVVGILAAGGVVYYEIQKPSVAPAVVNNSSTTKNGSTVTTTSSPKQAITDQYNKDRSAGASNRAPQNTSSIPNYPSSTSLNWPAPVLQTKTVGGYTYVLTKTCDDLEQGLCYHEIIQLVQSSTSSPRALLFSTSTDAISSPSFDISPRGDFASIRFQYAGYYSIDNVWNADSLIIVGTQKNFLKSFSDIELTTPKIFNEAKGREGYELALVDPDSPNGCVGHLITWSPDESSVSGKICLWDIYVKSGSEVIDLNLFKINTVDWSVQTSIAQ
jgi:hypothetical protein